MGRNIAQTIVHSAVIAVSAAVGFAGFGLMLVDSPGPLWSMISSVVMAIVGSCILALFSPRKWLLIAILCSWGTLTWAAMGLLMQQPKFRYLMVALPLAVAAGFTGSRMGTANRRRAG